LSGFCLPVLLGRRIAKQYKGIVTRWLWDGNVPLHEWQYKGKFPPQQLVNENGDITEETEPAENVITWVYEDGSFVPCAKIVGEESYSIVADYLGTPTHAFDKEGVKVWERELDVYGSVRTIKGDKDFIPQLYQGQYVDSESGLAYNRFRYYDCESGNYISQDPINLFGGLRLYEYVHDANVWTDVFGLSRRGNQATRDHVADVKDQFIKDNPGYTHTGGGLDAGGNKVPEKYIRPTNPVPGSTKEGSYADLTFESPSGQVVHINTVDKGAMNGMSNREWVNANRISTDAPNAIVITVKKGAKVNSGDLSVNGKGMPPGKIHHH